jgi:hypothetical protein
VATFRIVWLGVRGDIGGGRLKGLRFSPSFPINLPREKVAPDGSNRHLLLGEVTRVPTSPTLEVRARGYRHTPTIPPDGGV